MILNANELDATQTYKLLIATIVPRPIGWISTLSTDGVPNLAPFSFFTVVGRKPPVLSVTIQHRSNGVTLKDTYVNIRDTGEFVANLVTLPLLRECISRHSSTRRGSTNSMPPILKRRRA